VLNSITSNQKFYHYEDDIKAGYNDYGTYIAYDQDLYILDVDIPEAQIQNKDMLDETDNTYVMDNLAEGQHNISLTCDGYSFDYVFYVNTSQPDTTPPASVGDLRSSSNTDTWIYWLWDNPLDADFSEAIVYINGVNVVNTSNNYYNATGLTASTPYTIIVHTKDNVGNVNDTDVTDFVITDAPPDTTPPSTITGLSSPSKNITWIYWSWTNPADADFDQCIVYIDGVWKTNTSNNYYNATGLTADTAYTITVHTKDTNGNVNITDVNSTVTTDSASCPAGDYWSGSCQTCTVGYYCPGDNTRHSCDPGKYCASTGLSTPTGLCSAGYYCTGGATTATGDGQCNAGYYCPAGSDSPTENVCGFGNYCPTGSGSPFQCAAGSYCPSATESAPTTCTAGKYCATPGLSAPTGDCNAGYYCTTGSTSATQNQCGLGNYCPVGSSSATQCTAGNYCPTATEGSQTICTAGKYCATNGLSAPTGNCDAGCYCPAGSNASCQNSCTLGSYCPAGTATDANCGSGYYCPNTITQTICTIDYYCPGPRDTAPTACSIGTYSPAGSDEATDCNSLCGDGLIVVADEDCDDNNTNNADGCSSICEIESGWSCNGEPSNCSIIPDTTDPIVTLVTPTNGATVPDSEVSFQWTVTDDRDTTLDCKLWNNKSGTWEPDPSNFLVTNGTTQTYNNTGWLDGEYIWNVICEDDATNKAFASANRTFTVDSPDVTPPVVNLGLPLDGSTDTDGNITLAYIPTDETATSLSCDVYSITTGSWQIDFAGQVTNNASTGNYNYYNLANGDYRWNVECDDGTNQAFAAADYTFTIDKPIPDTTPPVVTLTNPANGAATQGGNVTVEFTATDDKALAMPCDIYSDTSGTWQADGIDLVNSTHTDGSYDYTSLAEGTYVWNVKCYDGTNEAFAPANRTFEVLINDPPVTTFPSVSTLEDSGAMDNWLDLWAYASDPDNSTDELTFTIVSQSNSSLINCSIDSNRYLDCDAPAPDQYGVNGVTIQTSDGNSWYVDAFMVKVNATNDDPVLDPISNIIVNEGELVQITPSASDIDGDSVMYTYTAPVNSSGQWQTTFTDAGIYTVNVTVLDGQGGQDSQLVNISVNDIQADVLVNYFTHQAPKPAVVGNVTFGFFVENTGTEDLTNIGWELDSGETNTKTGVIPSLTAGQQQIIFAKVEYTSVGAYTASITLDHNSLIPETNESNNYKTVNVAIN
jgi:cysteine-rich repeat protein